MTEQLKVIIAAEIGKFKENVDAAKKTIKDFIKEGVKDFDKFNEELQKVGDASKKFLKVTAGAVAGAGAALVALGASTSDYREAQAKLATAFQSAGGSAEEAKKTYNDLYRVLGDTDQATEAAALLGKLTTDQQGLSEWTNICQGVYATFGESLPIESLAEAANETAKSGELTGALTDALVWAGISEDEFKASLAACNTEAERENLIRSTLNGLYNDAATIYEENNAQVLAQNEAQTKLNDAMARLGEVTAPIMAMLTTLAADVLTQLTPYLEEFGEKYLPKIEKVLVKVGEAIGKVLTWIADNWELVSTLAAIIIGIATALSIFSTVMAVVNAVMAASPVTWIILAIVAAIAALVAIIVVIIKKWDEIKAATLRVWEAIKNAISTAINAIKNAVQTGFNWIKDKIVTPIQNAFNSVKTIFSNIVNTIKEKLGKARDFVKNIIDKIKGFFKFEWSLPKLKVPKFGITPSGWKVGDLLKGVIPKLKVEWHARGGVFDKPTLFNYGNSLRGLGENGAEAVVPLENNLGWLDKLATMLGERMGGGTPIVLQVDGKTLAQVSVDNINKLTKQTGSLPLVVM